MKIENSLSTFYINHNLGNIKKVAEQLHNVTFLISSQQEIIEMPNINQC